VKSFTAYEWLYVIRYTLPLFVTLLVPAHQIQILADIFVLTLKWCSPVLKRDVLPLLQEKYTSTMRLVRTELNLTTCDLNYHMPTHNHRLIKLWGPMIGYWGWAWSAKTNNSRRLLTIPTKRMWRTSS